MLIVNSTEVDSINAIILTFILLHYMLFRFPTLYFAPKNSKAKPKSYDVRNVAAL